jgi:phosphoglycolate phosphatase
MHSYRLVLFDFDGTLADSFPWFLDVVNDVADRFRFRRLDPEQLPMLRSYSARQLLQHTGIPRWKLPWIVRHMRRRMARDLDQIRLFDGIEQVLDELSAAGLRLALVSSNSEATVRAVLGPRADLFELYACGASIFGKADKFRRVLHRTGVAPEAAICVGDEIRDIDAARAVGLACGAVGWGYTDPEALLAQRPDRYFVQPAQLTGLLVQGVRDMHPPTGRSGMAD